jgi:hypothetical protein
MLAFYLQEKVYQQNFYDFSFWKHASEEFRDQSLLFFLFGTLDILFCYKVKAYRIYQSTLEYLLSFADFVSISVPL